MNGRDQICARCDKPTDAPVAVAEIHGNSGPGWTVHACPSCAPLYPKQSDPFGTLDTVAPYRSSQEANR